ncbi:CrcB family protein [Bifidobacterium mongoliense]|uniref:fluoride efflux transporter FluC n=1 Tax=Bifidobacterium mongoliense TaxID=518643 RepID=UPI0030EB3304
MIWFMVCVFGGLGAVSRFILDTSIQRWWNRVFPLSTVLINILAAFFVGLAAASYLDRTVSGATYLVFVLGFCGGFATFPAAVGQMLSLVRQRKVWSAARYLGVTLFGTMASLALGWWLISLGH